MSQDLSQNNKRIAKNTLLLYARMLLLMVVSLYTSRVTLDVLGVEDYGIYNVVGGVVAMFSVLSASLTSSIQRFLNFELGKNHQDRLNAIFSTAINIQVGMAMIVVFFAEVIGVWFLNHKMNIPAERMYAANLVLQCSILTFAVNLISVPYNATIIAHEKMSAFAYISIFEASLKLLVVYLLFALLLDRLIVYAVLLALVAVILRLIYGIYCKRNFEECTYHFVYDKSLFKKMVSFAGWNFIGSSSALLRDQGVNIAINIFCGPTVNAARGISQQVNNAVHHFVTNFMTAIRPQITKSYAIGDKDYLMSLIFYSSKIAFFMTLILSLPIIIEAPTILSIWLTCVPNHAVMFVRLTLIFVMFEVTSEPLVTAQQATGNIKCYQIIVGGIQSLNLPLAFLLLWLGLPPETTVILAILLGHCCLAARLLIMRNTVGLDSISFISNVYLRIWLVMITSSIIPLLIYYYAEPSILRLIVIVISTSLCCIYSILYLGIKPEERFFVLSKCRKFVKKLRL